MRVQIPIKKIFIVFFLSFVLVSCSYEDESSTLDTSTVVSDSSKKLSDNHEDDSDVENENEILDTNTTLQDISSLLNNIPEFSGDPYIAVNNNTPFFTEDDLTLDAFETYSSLDSLGRCGQAYANICPELMPTEERGEIGHIRPSGWHTMNYHELVPGNYLYNRCHLIAFSLAGENDNTRNLITGTRYFNINGMEPFEDDVRRYVKDSGHHVLYRVTPVYEDDNLVANGVLMEAKSIEDNNIEFCVYCFNVQPGIGIDYKTGESWVMDENSARTFSNNASSHEKGLVDNGVKDTKDADYVVNTSSKKFHLTTCSSVKKMSEKNTLLFNGTREDAILEGYSPCGNCNP